MAMKWKVNKYGVFAIITTLLLLASIGTSACKPSVSMREEPLSTEVIKWRMVTSWSADMLFYTNGSQTLCKRVAEMSGGRLIIEPYPADSIVTALQVFDAVSKGEVECAHTWPGYWRSKEPTFELFSSIPNQMVQQEWTIWLYGPSRGIDLWREFYAKYNVVPFPGGLIGPEFGFFTSKPVHSLNDFNGLKLRVSGIAARIGLDNYFRFYNTERPHQTHGYRTPAEVFTSTTVEPTNRGMVESLTPVPLRIAGSDLNIAPILS